MQKLDLKSYKVYKVINYGYIYEIRNEYIVDELPSEIIKNKLYTVKPGDTLYFDKKCKIPRNSLNDKFKRCIKKEKATCLVIPDKIPCMSIDKTDITIDVNEEHKIVVIGLANLIKNKNNLNSNRALATELLSLKYTQVFCKYLLNSNEEFYNELCEFTNICYEKDVAKFTRVNENNAISEDVINSIDDLFKSNNQDNIILAMRLLSELDYVNYSNIVRLILSSNYQNWYYMRGKFTVNSVKYMLNYLQPIGTQLRIKNVTEQEFSYIKLIIEKHLINKLQTEIEFTIADQSVNINYNLEVNYNGQTTS